MVNCIEYRIRELQYILTPAFNLKNKSPELYKKLQQELETLLNETSFKEGV